jgi:hypothetical protein
MDGGLADHGEVVTDSGHDQPIDLLVGRSREQLGTGGRSSTIGVSGMGNTKLVDDRVVVPKVSKDPPRPVPEA